MEKEAKSGDKKSKSFVNSTPKGVQVSSRPGIHDRDYNVSPILYDSNDSESSSEAENSNATCNTTPKTKLGSGKVSENLSRDHSSTLINIQNVSLMTVLGFLVLTVGVITNGSMSAENSVLKNTGLSMKEIKKNFPSQTKETWIAFESGINEIKEFNKPSVFLVLYEEQSKETINSLLANLTSYASCILNENCQVEPIVVDSEDLIRETSGFDFGFIIEKYKPLLQEKAIFVMFNLDQLPGELAQAFHTMCDEYTPLVSKTMYFFTVEVNSLRKGETDLALVEKILKNKWSDLKDDIFYPLFTRISNMVLRIVPENKL